MKVGDAAEVAMWMTGEETEEQKKHFKEFVMPLMFKKTAEQNEVEFGPLSFFEKKPGEDRVPPVPDHIHGQDVKLLVCEAKVVKSVPQLFVKPATGFCQDLRPEDLKRLRRITRQQLHAQNPGQHVNDAQCDAIIERLGPDAVVKTLHATH